ncbi:unnamed protein product [Rhodiola kirilowii]
MDQHKSNTSTLPTVQTVPVGSVSSMPASIPLMRPNEHRRFLEPVAPYGGGPQNVIMNSSALYMTPKTNFSGFQQMAVPDNNLRGMGALFNDTKSQYIQMPIKRKAPMENLPGYPLSPIVGMPNNKIEQLEHRPWLNPSASNMSNAQYQVQSAADVLASKQLAAQNRRTIQFQSGPPKSGPQKSLTSRSHPSQGQLSYKVQNQPNESVRFKLRESIRDALALFSEKDKSSSKGGASASAAANASDQMQEGSLLAKIASSVSHVELSGENPTAANGDCSTQIENVKIQLTDIDCDVGGSLQIHGCAGQDLNMIDLLPDDESITGDSIIKDDLLQGIGLAWLSDFDAWIAEKEGRDPKKQKVGESVGGAWEVKKTICPQNLALQIELELFNLFGGVNKKYKEKGRSLLFNLKDKNNPELREKVMSGEISPARLCSMTAEELASKELSEWRIAKAEEFEQMKILPDSEIDIRRLVKKTHKGEFQVEVEEDDVSVEVSVGSSSFPRRQTEAKDSKPQTDQETKPQSGQKPDGGQKKTRNDKMKSEEQNLQCNITIPSNESSDRMQRLIEDELKDAEFLQPIVSLDEFMESIHTEPPFENLRPDADKIAASPENDHTGAPSETKSAELSSDIHTTATFETRNNLNSTDPTVDIKPSENQPKEILPPLMVSKGERIWEGSLQLNVSSTVAVSLFFGRGERAPMKEWPRTIDIKGRVRMDAFEKFLQDLYKSQSRSIMVVHVVLKESEGEESEALNKVVDSYVADDRVGFAEPLDGLEVYMCPCHPKILDRIGKHLVKDQTEALTLTGDDKGLIGVIVSRKAHVSPKSSSHHKQRFKKHQQEHYISSRRQNHHQDRNINVNSPNLKPKFPVVPLVSSYSATDEDDLPPGFGPPVSQDDDDLPEFNFCGALSRSFPAQKPIGIQTQNRSADQLMQLVQKYGHSAVSAGSGAGGKYWKDGEDDIPEWQPHVPLTPAPQPTPTQVNYQPLNQTMLQHLINQQQRQKSSFQHPQAPVLVQTPISVTQHNTPPGWLQTGVWFNPQGPQQGQFYGTQSRGF